MKLTYLIILGLVLALAMPLMLADNNSATDNSGSAAVPTLTSANPAAETTSATDDLNTSENVGGLRTGWARFALFFTFNQEKKARAELDLARLELIRARIAANNNNSDAMERALDAHDKLLNDTERIIENLKARNRSSDNITGLDNAIHVHEARITKLGTLLANANLTDAQRAKLDTRLAQAENVTSHLRNVEAKVEEITAKIENKTANQIARDAAYALELEQARNRKSLNGNAPVTEENNAAAINASA